MNSLKLTGLLIVCGATAAYAQLPGMVRQVDDVQERQQLQQATGMMVVSNAAPALYPTETSDVGPQEVLMYPHHNNFTAFVDEQYFYCDNVFQNDVGHQSSDILVSTVNVAYTPAPFSFLGGTMAPRVGYEHEWYMYGLAGRQSTLATDYNPPQTSVNFITIGHFDFNVARPFADLTWKKDAWTGTLGFDARWLLDSGTYNEFYEEYVPNWTFGRTFQLCDKTSIYLGYQGDYRFTWSYHPPLSGTTQYPESLNDRTDQGILVAGTWWLCNHAAIQPYYRFQYTCFTEYKRHDFLHTVGLTVIMPITKNIIVRGFVSYDNMNTDGYLAQSFNNLNAGGGFNLSVGF
jgi:hypothetical protein